MQIEIDLTTLHKAEGKSTGRPGLVKRKVKVHRGGKVEKKPSVEEPVKKPKKPLAIMGLNKPEPEEGGFAHKLKKGDIVNLAGRIVDVKSVDKKNKTVTLGSEGSFIPDETLSFDDVNIKGVHETPEGKFKEEKPKPASHPRPTQRKKAKATPKEKPKPKPKPEKKLEKIDTKDLSTRMGFYESGLKFHPDGEKILFDVSDYTAASYYAVNDYLRTGESGNKDREDSINNISTFLKNAPKMDGTVYRGMSFFKDEPDAIGKFVKFLNQAKEGGSLTLKPFTSTSTDEKIATEFTKTGKAHTVTLEIKSKSGVYLNGMSQLPKENEVLFDKDSKFNISKVDKSGYPEHVRITMEEI
jgi:hypothetical protein